MSNMKGRCAQFSTCVYFNDWCRGRRVSVSELQTLRLEWENKRATVDQGHLELGTYSNGWFNLKTEFTDTHTRYFSTVSYNTHLHVCIRAQIVMHLHSPLTSQHFALHDSDTEGKTVCLCVCVCVHVSKVCFRGGVCVCLCIWSVFLFLSRAAKKCHTNTHAPLTS